MKLYLLSITFILTFSSLAFCQTSKKIFYNTNGEGCSEENAAFYRIASFDSEGRPIGKIKDYYITNELQIIADSAIMVDSNDDYNSIFVGTVVGYSKKGIKEFERNYSLEGDLVYVIDFYDNGNKKNKANYVDGLLDGLYYDYHESGKIKRQYKFSRGELIGRFFTECDEFDYCQKVFYDDFASEAFANEWDLVKNDECKCEILPSRGLLMRSSSDDGFKQTTRIPLDLSNDFSIETIVSFKNGSTNSGHGLIWGFKDWDNYFCFLISANGYYKICSKIEGITVDITEWTKSENIHNHINRNLLKILRVNDKMYFSINRKIVHSDEFFNFRGNEIGFYILSGKKEILYEYLEVKQDINYHKTSSVIEQSNNQSKWSGNGSGFFIDNSGYIATNFHVIEDAEEIEIEFTRNGLKENFPAKVVLSDQQNDISIIKIASEEFKHLNNIPFNFKTSITDVGSNVFALGYPMALTLMGSEIKFTDGKVSSKTGLQGDITSYQISVPIQPGNSGGPLFDFDGNLIGITTSTVNREYDITENVNYAVKSSYLRNLIEVLDNPLELPNDRHIANLSLTEKIKVLSNYVVLIKVK